MLFDVDGVLIHSLSAHRKVWRQWARDHHLDVETVWGATHGRRPEDTVASVAPGLDAAQERAHLDRLLERYEGQVAAFTGAAVLLNSLSELPWAIVTSGSRAVTIDRFERLGLPLPQVAVCGEDVRQGKPHPEGYLRASAQLGVPPPDCVVVEDAPSGIAAARAAGCHVLAITTTHHAAACEEADEILADLTEVAGWMDLARGRLPREWRG